MEYQIILGCINPIDNQKINELSIYQIFSQHTTVRNIKIFSRCNTYKAFIEIDKSSVEKCINALHMEESAIGILKVYKSYKDNINFDKDLQQLLAQCSNDKKINNQQNLSIVNKLNQDDNSYKSCIENNFERPKYSNLFCKEFRGSEKIIEGIGNPYNSEKNNNHNTSSENISYTLNKYQNIFSTVANTSNFVPLDSGDCINYHVIMIKNINIDRINCQMLINIFGCFGNVKAVLLNHYPAYGLIEMEDAKQVNKAIKNLNHISFFGKEILIDTFNCQSVTEFFFNAITNDNVEFMKGKDKYFRYRKALSIKINKPSKILHITSLPQEYTNYRLYQLLSELHEPLLIVKLDKTGTNSNMFLAEFEDISQALEIISVFHNKKIENKLLKLSFSQTIIEN